jgi:putative ABC transport system substrate-binding protein
MTTRMNRRSVVAITLAGLAAPRILLAQSAKRVYRIAILDDSVENARAEYWKIFRNRLRELGLVDGKDVTYEVRYARGDNERLPALAAELVALKPDILVTISTPPTSALIKATSSIPIVFTSSGDPVGSGLVASLARPGGNVTGISINTPETGGKQLELLRELSPAAIRFAYLTDPSNKTSMEAFRQIEARARAMNVTIRMLDGRKRAELERSFETIKRERVQGLVVGTAGLLLEHRQQIVQFAAREKLPAVYPRRDYVDAGGLLSYSTDIQFGYLRGADFVDRILKGAKPADLPVEQTSNVRMVINLKTARALGMKIPDLVRLRADEIIE